jgi:uncharacterized protein (TIGR00369 family)
MRSDASPPPDSWGEPRTRTVSWWDPMVGARAMRGLSGREYLQAMINGRLPQAPIGGLIAMTAVSVGEGTVQFRCQPDEWAYNPIGVIHGGLVCTLLDSVAGCAVHSTLPAGMGFTSLEIKVSYLRPVRQGDGELTAVGRVTKPGRRAAFADGEVRDEHGRLIATASSTCLVFPLPEE